MKTITLPHKELFALLVAAGEANGVLLRASQLMGSDFASLRIGAEQSRDKLAKALDAVIDNESRED